jgi:hypothetical protein
MNINAVTVEAIVHEIAKNKIKISKQLEKDG